MAWIVLISSIAIFNAVAVLIRKSINFSENYTTVIFALAVSAVVDVFASYRYKAWGFFEVDKTEYSALLVYLGIYPAAAVIIINWYPYRSAKLTKLLYLLGWAVFSTAYEWLSLKVGIMWHIHWNLLYSFVLYVASYYVFLILHVKAYRRLTNKPNAG